MRRWIFALPALFAASETLAANQVITITGMQVVPQRLEVRSGDTVTWKNEDLVPHTVTSRMPVASNDAGNPYGQIRLIQSQNRQPSICISPATLSFEYQTVRRSRY